MAATAWWNGRLVDARAVSLPFDDTGLLQGDGLFETLRIKQGRARDVEAHLDRLLAGLIRIDLETPAERQELAAAVQAVAAGAAGPVARLRITVFRGAAAAPACLIAASPYQPLPDAAYEDGVPVVLLPDLLFDTRRPLAGLKSLSYGGNALALRRAAATGAWDALLANEHGHLVAGSRSNLVVVLDGHAWTPPLADGCLPGTIRRRLLEAGALAERPLTPADLDIAEEVLLTNSLVGVLSVGRVLDCRLVPGAHARRLRALVGF